MERIAQTRTASGLSASQICRNGSIPWIIPRLEARWKRQLDLAFHTEYDPYMKRNREKSGFGFWASVTLVALLVAYPLSIGPYLYLSDVAYSKVVFLDPIYDPLRWIAAHSEPFNFVLNWYSSLWRVNRLDPFQL